MHTNTYRAPQVEVRAECDVPMVETYVDCVRSRLAKSVGRNPQAFEDLRMTVTLTDVQPRQTLDTRQVVVSLTVEAESRGIHLSKEFRGKYYESNEGSALGCLAGLLLGPLGLFLTLGQTAARRFGTGDVAPQWVVWALEVAIVDVDVALDQLVGTETEDAAFFRALNTARWIAALLFGLAGAAWLALRTSPEYAILGGVGFAIAGLSAVHFVRPFLLPSRFWSEEPLGRTVLRAYGVASVWKMRLVSLLLLVAIASALYFAGLAILKL